MDTVFGARATIYTYYPAVLRKVKDGDKLFESFKDSLRKTGLFEAAGGEMKYVIRQKPTKQQIEQLTELVKEFAEQVQNKGLIE